MSKEAPDLSTRRKFLQKAAWGALGITALDFFESQAQTYASLYQSWHAQLRPNKKEVDGAKATIEEYKLKSEQAAQSGTISDLSKSVDPEKVEQAYSIIDKDTNPQKYHPQEFAEATKEDDKNLRDTIAMLSLTFLSMIPTAFLAVRKNAIETNSEENDKNSGDITVKHLGSGGRIVTG